MSLPSRVLIVDDDALVRRALRKQLILQGYEVAAAEDGETALFSLEGDPPDLVLLDVDMPGASGLDVLRDIRRTYDQAELPVVMLSGRSDEEAVVRALDHGANDFVSKGDDLRVLFARIRSQLERRISELARRSTEARFNLAAAGANDGLFDWDVREGTFYLSPRWCALLGYSDDDAPQDAGTWLTLVHPADLPRLQARLNHHLDGETEQVEVEHRLMDGHGQYRWVVTRCVGVRDEAGAVVRLAGSQADVSEPRMHDDVTGLPNRHLFLEQVGQALHDAREPFAVMVVDVDRFKRVNDGLGHSAGDALLRACSERIQRCLRSAPSLAEFDALVERRADAIARVGGDDFALLVEGLSAHSDAERIAARVLRAFEEPFDHGGQRVHLSASVGICPGQAIGARVVDPEILLSEAETAVGSAKAEGGGRYAVFEAGMYAAASRRLRLEADLKTAAERDELVLHFQPILAMQPGRPDRVESLVRWQHPERGFVSPMEFIPLAEETGDIHSIGEWVLRTACEQAACWNEDSPIEVAVNVSAKQFHSEGFVSLVARVLEETGLDPSCLELELTESVCVGREEEMIATLQALKALDVRLSMDDFGTGYSSLAYLKRFPIDTLKVDRAFVRELPDSTEDASLVQGIIGMARALGKEVVAEGVETPEQAEMLCRFGAEYLQGYYFGRPVPAEEITRMIHRRGHPIATGAIRPAV